MGAFVQARLGPVLLNGLVAEHRRGDAVEL